MTFLMKVVLCGDKGVGKTTIQKKYFGREFQSKYMMTIGADFSLKEHIVDGRTIKFQIWSLKSQSRFGSVRSVYYLGCLGAILIFDVTKRETFENLDNWIKEIWNHNGKGAIPLVIIGNKIDLRNTGNYPDSISDKMAIKYCNTLSEQTEDQGFDIFYYPFSTLINEDANEILEYLGRVYFDYLDHNKKTSNMVRLASGNRFHEEFNYLKSSFNPEMSSQDLSINDPLFIKKTSLICPNCNEEVDKEEQYCHVCGYELIQCQICKKYLVEIEFLCPNCLYPFHTAHWLEYYKVKGFCPVCNRKVQLNESDW